MGSLTRAAEEETAEEWSGEAVVYVNGVRRVLPDGLAHLTLLQYLRGRALITLPLPASLSLSLCVFFCYFGRSTPWVGIHMVPRSSSW